jgi:hypothetical protein
VQTPCVTQVPFWQVWPEAQVVPQAPQLLTSLLRSLQLPLQQAGVVPVQVVPHVPQLWISVCSSTHMPPQQFCPAGQSPAVPQVHAPLTHVSPEAQTWPQAPQLFGSVCTLVQVPLQTMSLPVHRQIPCLQLAPDGQMLPHTPQLLVSVLRLTQIPLQRVVPHGQPVQTPLAQVWHGKQA